MEVNHRSPPNYILPNQNNKLKKIVLQYITIFTLFIKTFRFKRAFYLENMG